MLKSKDARQIFILRTDPALRMVDNKVYKEDPEAAYVYNLDLSINPEASQAWVRVGNLIPSYDIDDKGRLIFVSGFCGFNVDTIKAYKRHIK